MRVVCWGTYDLGKPRTRILLRGMRENGVELTECHSEVWRGVRDKSQLFGRADGVIILLKWLLSYPKLIVRYMRLPSHDVVFVGYMGHLDVLVIRPFAWIRKTQVVWDAFLSLYDVIVIDRKLVRPNGIAARLIYGWEWLACRSANMVVLDTQTHASYFQSRYEIPPERTGHVYVGVEPEVFPPKPRSSLASSANSDFTVLFYGQFIPGHGIETIIRAAQLAVDNDIQWIIAGIGQDEGRIRSMLEERPVDRLTWIPWIPYNELASWIHSSGVCLGHFGDSEKVARVIPNKAFEILSAGGPLITRDTPAIRELLSPKMEGVAFVPPADPDALLQEIRKAMARSDALAGQVLHQEVASKISPAAIGRELIDLMQPVSGPSHSTPTS